MGAKAAQLGVNMTDAQAKVEKTMIGIPRRIGKIAIHIQMPSGIEDEKIQKKLERAVHRCPVSRSLHPDLEKEVVVVF